MKMKVLLILTSACSFLLDQGVSGAGSDGVSVSVIEGNSVTLPTDVNINQQDRMTWYFNAIRIAYINGVQKICTDDQCDERFRDRLKLDNQTGSLTITNTRTTDSGDYKLLIGGSSSPKIFNVIVTGVSADERDKIEKRSVKEGESVTLDPGEIKNTNDSKMWYFNETLIAEITGDQSEICIDDQCNNERFRDRLKLDHQTGSLTITNTRTTDSGDYQLKTYSGSRRQRRSTNNVKRFVVTVSADTDPGASPVVVVAVAVAGTVAALAAAAGMMYYRHRSSRKRDMEENNQEPLRKTYSEKEEDKDQMT